VLRAEFWLSQWALTYCYLLQSTANQNEKLIDCHCLGLEPVTFGMQARLFDRSAKSYPGKTNKDSNICSDLCAVIGTTSSDETYLTIKMDSVTHQYTIGTPVNPNLLSSPGVHSLSPGSNINRWHSLAAFGTADERGEVCVCVFVSVCVCVCGVHSLSPGSNINRWHSLAAFGTADERGEVFVCVWGGGGGGRG
jgi:hypothetical protein